ncbi:10 kDa chaperonin 1 [Candidatus Cyrtobacter comes]|uniref:Co-chaperonin GroES n=1 Tax=Candidatus Cyrtobacter comes TaxID=675776 RepID=A0ABU5L829_9RICK|nr:co-chaperone GroES [Candidatus Cyrtobacter comes]MDZ5762276.1 10 kDa chaperonin 1 [Candidatus Cyrtobacter comes]
MKNIKPLHDRIMVERVEQEERTKGGLFLPESAQEKPIIGVVIAVGNGALLEDGKLRPLYVKEGDKVLFAKWGGTEVKLDGKDYLIMKESDVLAIIS